MDGKFFKSYPKASNILLDFMELTKDILKLINDFVSLPFLDFLISTLDKTIELISRSGEPLWQPVL